jgi:hypothetical protein
VKWATGRILAMGGPVGAGLAETEALQQRGDQLGGWRTMEARRRGGRASWDLRDSNWERGRETGRRRERRR